MSAALLLQAADELCRDLAALRFAEAVTHVYNPLIYARAGHEAYVRRFGEGRKRVLLLGMNPGPWGMAQTGVPFGEIPAVRNWMGIREAIDKPRPEHPQRPLQGFACTTSEVSGRRLWGLFAQLYPNAQDFFASHFVLNYCPLVFMEEGGKNRTPDKLAPQEIAAVQAPCDRYLTRCIEILSPEWLVGIGGYAEAAFQRVAPRCDRPVRIGKVLHPSPASPVANRDWAGTASRQLRGQGIW